jgi:C1A family cysteine protease
MKVVAILLVAAIAGASALSELDYQNQFVSWMNLFSKTYQHEEFFHRFNTFKSWVDFVALHNAANHTWEAGLNQFSDLTPAEFKAQYLTGLDIAPVDTVETAENLEIAQVGDDVDWRDKGAVTPVKNQGQCGSCWAFSAVGIVEGWGFTTGTKGTLNNLAEQQLVDCAGSYGNQGCNGGWHDKAVDYLADVGSCLQTDYPYTARDGSCKKTCKPVVKPNKSVMGKTEAALAAAIQVGPVGVAVDASGGFQSYKTGIFSGPCGTQLNHAILAVGSNSASATKYWIVKNSWGTSWGNKGYIHMAQGKNLCGINQHTAWVKA